MTSGEVYRSLLSFLPRGLPEKLGPELHGILEASATALKQECADVIDLLRRQHDVTRSVSQRVVLLRRMADAGCDFAVVESTSHGLALHRLDDGMPPRLGLAVSRKVDPHAIGRNRIKRVLRDAFRHLRGELADGAYVVVARPAAAHADNAALRSAFRQVLQRAGALPAPAAAGSRCRGAASSATPTMTETGWAVAAQCVRSTRAAGSRSI